MRNLAVQEFQKGRTLLTLGSMQLMYEHFALKEVEKSIRSFLLTFFSFDRFDDDIFTSQEPNL